MPLLTDHRTSPHDVRRPTHGVCTNVSSGLTAQSGARTATVPWRQLRRRTGWLVADRQQKSIDCKHGTRSDAHTAESVRRVVPTQHHHRSADRHDDHTTRHGHQGLGEPRHDEECRGSERSHSGDCSRRVREGRALEMAADERLGHRLHDQHRRYRSDEARQCSHPVPGQSRHDTERGCPGDQDRQRTEVSHVGGPSRGQVCGQEPKPDGVHPVGPRSVNESQPGESRRTEQEAPQEHLQQRLGVMAPKRRRASRRLGGAVDTTMQTRLRAPASERTSRRALSGLGSDSLGVSANESSPPVAAPSSPAR